MARHCKVCGFRCILSGTVFRYLICVAAVAIVAIGAVLCGRTTSAAEGGRVMETLPMTTQEHLRRATWWPTKQLASQEKFVGSAACARCHADFAATQGTSQMAHTLMPAARAEALQKHLSSEYHAGPYTYSLRGSGSGVDARIDMRVGDGKQARSAGLQWAFGSGEVGQSYLWQKDGGYRETRFNYFETLDGFDGTPGRMRGAPLSIDMAVGRTVEPFEAKTCFACHTTNMSADMKTIVPGVGCEACHGPGADHVAAMEARRAAGGGVREAGLAGTTLRETKILSPHDLSPAHQVDLCGSCHSTPWDVRVMGAAGSQTVRFPAYRLEKSKCWGRAGDDRITCTACHDPHAPLERNAAAYDEPCLACHVSKLHPVKDEQHMAAACPVAATKCVSCHMPKVNVPEMHYKFTDHNIRIARADAPFPD